MNIDLQSTILVTITHVTKNNYRASFWAKWSQNNQTPSTFSHIYPQQQEVLCVLIDGDFVICSVMFNSPKYCINVFQLKQMRTGFNPQVLATVQMYNA